ncbi:hypothetical protein U91I_00666 [alpha proteobacterium U9-1i]|nr:hypothetical protein U91I_00666 [alpha proteobacterium U9-1i]
MLRVRAGRGLRRLRAAQTRIITSQNVAATSLPNRYQILGARDEHARFQHNALI